MSDFDTSKPIPFETVVRVGINPILSRAFKEFGQKTVWFAVASNKEMRQVSAKATAWSSWHGIKVSTEKGSTHFMVHNHGPR